jgi:hypothetical protein
VSRAGSPVGVACDLLLRPGAFVFIGRTVDTFGDAVGQGLMWGVTDGQPKPRCVQAITVAKALKLCGHGDPRRQDAVTDDVTHYSGVSRCASADKASAIAASRPLTTD